MAENKEVLSKFEEQIQCPVCLDTFTSPKLLQCHHVYCWGCLVKLVERDEQGQLVLSCPNCHKITPVPANGVKGLQPAFQTNNLLEMQGPLKKALSHDRKDDASVDITDEAPVSASTPIKVLSYCLEHASEEIKLYCEDCKKFNCVKCVISGAEHHSHSHKMLDSYREDILSSLEPVRDRLSISSDAAKKIDTQCAEIRDQQADIDARLDQTFELLHKILDARKAELMSQLCHLADNKVKILTSQKDQIMKTHAQLEQFESDVYEKLQQLKDDREIVAMKQSVTTQIGALTSTFQPEAMNPISVADMELTMPGTLSTLCRNYGTILSKELHPDPSKCSIMHTDLESATVGTPLEINVKAIDHFGNPCLEDLPPLLFELKSEIGEVVRLGQCEGSHSHYAVMFAPTVKGQHQLHARIYGQHISGSPFTVHVRSSVDNLGTRISRINGVSKPWGIAINKKREIIVSESNKHCISVYSISGKKLRSFGSHGSREGQFKSPRGIALDDSGNIVVADHGNHQIQIFTEEGQFLKTVGSKGSGELQFNNPNDIAFNTFNRSFYIVDDSGYVQILTSQFRYVYHFKALSIASTQRNFVLGACAVCCDKGGLVYITDVIKGKIHVFTMDGSFLRAFGKLFGGQFHLPSGIAFDSNNYLYVSTQFMLRNFDVSVLTSDGQRVKKIGVNANGQEELLFPYGLTVDQYGIVYVCDLGNNRICMY